MKRILTYRSFESNVPFTRENIQKSIREKINEPEVESIITDMCADLMDEYNVAIHFNWGWVVKVDGRNDFRRDSTIELIKRSPSQSSHDSAKRYFKELSDSTTRYVEVIFDRYDRGSSELKFWKEGFDLDFINIMDFVRNYFPRVEVKQGSITLEVYAARFKIIFK